MPILSDLRGLAWLLGKNGKLGSCYLAGPMTGLPEFNQHAFRVCAQTLRASGWTVLSPLEMDNEEGIDLDGTEGNETFDFRSAMSRDLKAVCEVDAVIVMPGWEQSTGARLEVYVALAVDTPVYTYLNQRKIEELPSSTDGSAPGAWTPPVPRSSGEVGCAGPASPTLSHDSAERKATPITSGVLDYFPAALAAVAAVSKAGNEKHNPGEPLHHARGKSMDHADSIARHLIDRGHIDPDTGLRHSAEGAWRSLALLQQELEDAGEAPLPRGAQ